METLDRLEANINDAGNEKISTLKEAEIRKIYERIGNMILQKAKDPDYKEIKTINKKDWRDTGQKIQTASYKHIHKQGDCWKWQMLRNRRWRRL